MQINIKEQNLVDLGFTKEFGEDFYYYVYNFARGLSLITKANDEVVNNEWEVDFFESNPAITFTDKESLKTLIKLIKTNIKCK